ncbi:trypsin alpha-3-like, partial [Asbolus verrucosus]
VIIRDASSDDKSISPKIIGGRIVVNQTEFSFMVSVRTKGRHICGGSIVDYRHVLTAAHCCFNNENKPLPPQMMSIAAGTLNIRYLDSFTVIKNAHEIIVHPRYQPENILNDIAIIRVHFFNNVSILIKLLKISGQFEKWNKHVSPISLANFIPASGNCTICGWGNTSRLNYQLLYVNVPIINEYRCKNYYKEITSKMICAGGNGRDSCQVTSAIHHET